MRQNVVKIGLPAIRYFSPTQSTPWHNVTLTLCKFGLVLAQALRLGAVAGAVGDAEQPVT
jgi:hypothetical protein